MDERRYNTDTIYNEIKCLASFEPTKLDEGGLTYPEVRDMLVTVRRIKTCLEVLWAEMENKI